MAKKEASLWLKVKTTGQEAIGTIKDSIKELATVGAAALATFGAAIVKSIGEFKEAERASNGLTQAMVNSGIYSKELKNDYLAQAEALQKTTIFGDDAIVQAQTAIQQQIGQTKITKELTSAVLDFAQAQGMDAASAAEAIGKSIGTSTNALARYGIEIDTGASKSEKMAQAIAGLNAKFGGQAEAAAQGLGALDQLNNVVGELFEALGERLAPTVGVIAGWFVKLGTDTTKTTGFIDVMAGTFEWLVRVGMNVIAAFERIGVTIGGVIGTVIGAGEKLIQGQFAQAKEALSSGFDEIGKERERIQKEYDAKILELDNAALTKKEESLQKEEEMLKTSHEKKREINQQAHVSQSEQDMLNKLSQIEAENALIGATDLQRAQQAVTAADEQYKIATTHAAKMRALKTKEIALDNLATEKQKELDKKTDEETYANRMTALDKLSQLQHSKSREMVAIGKAAALAEIGINTHKGALAAYAALSTIPVVGPGLGVAAAAALYAYGLERAASVSGIQLAEGGIVKARPGGIQATIGEGGQDEAVIPLDKAGMMGGNTYHITVNGGLLGDENSAYEFAKAIDRNLLKLRQNNESQAFDSGVV